jgi:hypothetical protein
MSQFNKQEENDWMISDAYFIIPYLLIHFLGERCLQSFGWEARRQETTGKT